MLDIENAPDILTIDEAAEMLRVDRVTIKRYIKSGKIPVAHLTHRTVRILKSNLLFLFKPTIKEL